eukprot:2936620-Alexandrium_andersonii.AAC.1
MADAALQGRPVTPGDGQGCSQALAMLEAGPLGQQHIGGLALLPLQPIDDTLQPGTLLLPIMLAPSQ